MMPCARHRSATFRPASPSLTIARICSSLNLLRFIGPPWRRTHMIRVAVLRGPVTWSRRTSHTRWGGGTARGEDLGSTPIHASRGGALPAGVPEPRISDAVQHELDRHGCEMPRAPMARNAGIDATGSTVTNTELRATAENWSISPRDGQTIVMRTTPLEVLRLAPR